MNNSTEREIVSMQHCLVLEIVQNKFSFLFKLDQTFCSHNLHEWSNPLQDYWANLMKLGKYFAIQYKSLFIVISHFIWTYLEITFNDNVTALF